MPETTSRDFAAILKTLASHRVGFVVVGGVAAALEGAPVNTFDLDIVHSREPENVTRLLAALESLEAIFRSRPERKPDASHLASVGHQLLMTRFGPLDILGAIGRGHTYQDLLPHSEEMTLGGGVCVRVLNLEMLIAVKEEVADEKDLAALPVLRRTREEKRRKATR